MVNRCPWADAFFKGKCFTPDTFALRASVSGAMSKSMSWRTSASVVREGCFADVGRTWLVILRAVC